MVATSGPARPVVVSAYHEEVDGAVAAMDASLARGGDLDRAIDVLERELRGPTARSVIDRLPYARAALVEAAARELQEPKLGLASSPKDRAALVRILLLHQIDAMWWPHVTPYADQAAVESAPELLSLTQLDKAGALRFSFAAQPVGWVRRGRDHALRRMAPRLRPRVSGMKFLVARAEIVAVLNEIADALREQAPAGTPALWVNSIVRSVRHQKHLSDLGYSALLPSSHCVGYGADVEMTWFESFGAAAVLQKILLGYRDRGVLNVIGEGQAWHLCLSPDHVSDYGAPADRASDHADHLPTSASDFQDVWHRPSHRPGRSRPVHDVRGHAGSGPSAG